MSIVKMKRLHIIALRNVRRQLLRDLTRLGCVEIERSGDWLMSPEWSGFLRKTEEEFTHSQLLSEIGGALDALHKYADVKKGMLAPRMVVGEKTFYDENELIRARESAKEINTYSKEITARFSEESKCIAQKTALEPWTSMDIPLDFRSGGSFSITYGVCPSSFSLEEMEETLSHAAEAAALSLVHSDKEQHYLVLVAHKSSYEEALEACKQSGFSTTTLKGFAGTVADNIRTLDARIEEIGKERDILIEKIAAQTDAFGVLGLAYDALALEAQRDDILSVTGSTKKTIYFEGWVPAFAEKEIAAVLEGHECAYEFGAAREDEDPPVLLSNNAFVRPFGEITNLYGVPHTNSLVDPNPFVAVSYFLFFGIMFSDAAYGIVLMLGSLYVLKKANPAGAFGNFMRLAFLVGISTTLWGFFFGSFFGDIVSVVSERITGTAVSLPAVIDPMVNPITMLILSLAFGIIHLFVGMGLSCYRMIKRGQWLDAVWEVMVWYIVIIGILLFLLGFGVGMPLFAGALILVALTAGRGKKGIGKVIAPLGSLYNHLTGFLSDILSYSRLMALSMATGVVASVFNTLGNMFGTSIFGWLLLIVIFVIGQTFNFAICILGAFVHSCRLEYVEFFSKFFEGGGRAFKPLFYKTKYIQIEREEI